MKLPRIASIHAGKVAQSIGKCGLIVHCKPNFYVIVASQPNELVEQSSKEAGTQAREATDLAATGNPPLSGSSRRSPLISLSRF